MSYSLGVCLEEWRCFKWWLDSFMNLLIPFFACLERLGALGTSELSIRLCARSQI